MKRNRKGSRKQQQTIQVWTYDQARRVLPYVASIVKSLRDYRLEAVQHERTARSLARAPGRPDRQAILAHEEAVRKGQWAKDRYQETLDELHTLDIYCLDAVRGQALIPFAQDDQLAWYVFDLFETEPLKFWRYHKDPLETRRPIVEALEGPAPSRSVIA